MPPSRLLRPWLCALALLLIGPPPGPAAPVSDPFDAPPRNIAKLLITGTHNVSAETIRAALTEKVGNTYSPQAAEKDRAAVQALGTFRAVTAQATSDPTGGVDVTYTVTEYPVVTAIKFVADTPDKQPSVPASQLLSQMTLKVGQVLNVNTLNKDIAALFNLQTGYVAQQGYLFDVKAKLDIEPTTGVLTIPLLERRVQSVVITGNSRIKTDAILARMHVRPGDIYFVPAIQKDAEAIYSMGAFQEIKPGTWDAVGVGQVRITVPVVEWKTASIAALDETQARVIPLQYDPVTCRSPIIQVSINGKPPLAFIVDTGATSPLLLDLWAVRTLGLKTPALTSKQNGYVDAPVVIQSAAFQGRDTDNSITFNIAEARAVDLSFIPDAFRGVRVAGIVGLGLLAPVTTRFDFAAKTLTVYSYAHPPLRVPGAVTLPLTVNGAALGTVQATLAPGVSDTLILDTGSDSTQIHRAAAQKLHPSARAYTFSGRIEGWYELPQTSLPEITLGALRVPNVLLATEQDATSASLGMDILAGYQMTLDGPNRELTLALSTAGGRYTQGWSGVKVRQDAQKNWRVKTLRAGSPALQAGLQVGDAIETVSGLAVHGLPEAQVDALTRGLAGRSVSLARRRAGQVQTLFWVPLNNLTAPRDALYGLTMQRPTGGDWEIMDVLPGSPADQAGLRAGDKITTLGGVPVASASLDQETHLVIQSPLPLVVTRAGRATPLMVTLTAPPQKK